MTATKDHIQVLDALRFFAALCVVMAHYTFWVLNDQFYSDALSDFISEFSAIGMMLFFTLSGFVIHYNYSEMLNFPGGFKKFWIARFSRLYPLYGLIFGMEMIGVFWHHGGSCGHAGENLGNLFALPYHLTFTQSWFFNTTCNNSLIYQFHMVSGVSWSLSVEIFLYLLYAIGMRKLFSGKSLLWLVLLAGAIYTLVLGNFGWVRLHQESIDTMAKVAFGSVATLAHGYQDSLIRWLYYFNPMIWLAPFACGIVIAELRLRHHTWILQRVPSFAQTAFIALSLISLAAFFYVMRGGVYTLNEFFGRTFAFYLMPFVVWVVCGMALFSENRISRAIGNPLFVKLGEASYSMYLLHAFLGRHPRDLYFLNLNPWMLYAICLVLILCISRASYLLYERPMQRWVRSKLLAKTA